MIPKTLRLILPQYRVWKDILIETTKVHPISIIDLVSQNEVSVHQKENWVRTRVRSVTQCKGLKMF